jgi:hypothetical protein
VRRIREHRRDWDFGSFSSRREIGGRFELFKRYPLDTNSTSLTSVNAAVEDCSRACKLETVEKAALTARRLRLFSVWRLRCDKTATDTTKKNTKVTSILSNLCVTASAIQAHRTNPAIEAGNPIAVTAPSIVHVSCSEPCGSACWMRLTSGRKD